MPKFSPKDLPPEAWVNLPTSRAYAFRANPSDTLFFRFGQGHGVYISVAPAIAGRVVNIINFETNESSLAGKIPLNEPAVIGRTNECSIKIMHAIISRQHLKFQIDGNILIVEDVGSTNGTYYLSDLKCFDINDYIQNHPPDKAVEQTMDAVHEAFGPTLDDFLRSYSQKKGQNK